jgi:hypothetical protein
MSGLTKDNAPVVRIVMLALFAFLFLPTDLPVLASDAASHSVSTKTASTKTANAAVSLDPSQRDLNHAQAAYYRAQIEDLQHKNKWGNLVREQLGGLIGGVTGFIAAVIAFFTFVTNFSTTIRNERDTQFFEALKRFGDKDSTISRSSGAGLLGIIGATNLPRFLWWFPDRPHLHMAFEQLIAGLRLEENGGVMVAIRDAARRLVALMSPGDLSRLTELIGEAPWREFNGSVAGALGRYMAFTGVLEQATAITGFPKQLLENLTHNPSYHAGLVAGEALKNNPNYVGSDQYAQFELIREIGRINALRSIQEAASACGLLGLTPTVS